MNDRSRVKISSNPYAQRVEIFLWDMRSETWGLIDEETDPDSRLSDSDIVRGFFPFRVSEIVEVITRDYQGLGDNQDVEVVFEGTADVFTQLRAACEGREGIVLTRSSRMLENARDVLPKIKERFADVRPLIDESVRDRADIASDLRKFDEASRDVVPLVVLGNYSVGKSSFINALIGAEVLPCGREPLTAKVFQITRSPHADRCYVRFRIGQTPVELAFDAEDLTYDAGLIPADIAEGLQSALDDSKACNMTSRVSLAIQFLNTLKKESGQSSVADLIEVEVPFDDAGSWYQDSNFVIFDTPGSNSATNSDHGKILREAMADLSNGLLVYVATPTTLDTSDNAKLLDEIKDIEAIDRRFAIVIANKADADDLPEGGYTEREIDVIRHEAIPMALDAQGIFYVSSIMGLGAKTKGKFSNRNSMRIFSQQRLSFEDPEDEFYMTLYRYNITPEQIKMRLVRESEDCSDRLFANSGLFAVEREIRRFARRHSAYNKCQQSMLLLGKVADATAKVIGEARSVLERDMELRRRQLERDKKKLLEAIHHKDDEIDRQSKSAYAEQVTNAFDILFWHINVNQLMKDENELTAANAEDLAIDDREEVVRKSLSSISGNFGKRVNDFVSGPDISKLGDAFQGISEDVAQTVGLAGELLDARTTVKRRTADKLLERARLRFKASVNLMLYQLGRKSSKYWRGCAEKERSELLKIATGTDALFEDGRKQLADLIIGHRGIEVDSRVDEVFEKDPLRLWDLGFIKAESLSNQKLAQKYNEEVNRAFVEACPGFEEEHSAAFDTWRKDLIKNVEQNIEEYNPDLRMHVAMIRLDEEHVATLTRRLEKIESARADVRRLIDWYEGE